MANCKNVEHWFTSNISVPVTRFIYEATETCEQVKQWVKEEVWDKVEEFISRVEEFCEDLPWPLDWACDVVTIVVRVVTYVPRTIWHLIINTVCKIWLKVIGSFIELVLRTISWFISFLVCVFTEPLEALESLLDFWRIFVDMIGAIFDIITVAIDIAIEFVDDFIRLLDSIGDTLGPLGWLLAPWKALAKLATVLLMAARDFTDGVKDGLTGVLSFNPCTILRGLANMGVAIIGAAAHTGFIVFSPIRVLGMVYAGGRDNIDRWHLNQIIVDSINGAFGAGSDRAKRSISSLAMGSEAAGRKFKLAPYRMYLSSEATNLDLRELHQRGVINLYTLAGFPGSCRDALNQPDGEVVYANSPLRVTHVDIRRYLRDGRGSTPEFWVFPITIDKFKRHIDLAKRKSTAIGVQYSSMAMGVFRAHSSDHVPLNASDTKDLDDSKQQVIFGELGRNGKTDDLSVIPVLSHFHYVRTKNDKGEFREGYGLASWFRPPDENVGSTNSDQTSREYISMSGVSYRNLSPDWVYRWVLTHELGHYVGLDHDAWGVTRTNGVPSSLRSLDEIMYSPSSGELDPGAILFEYFVAGGEPRFTVGDIRQAWYWMTHGGKVLFP